MAEVAQRVLQVGATFGNQVVSQAVRPYAGEAGRRVPVRTILPARSRGGLFRNLEPPGSRLPGAEVAVIIASSRVISGDIDPRPVSGRQELLENVVNRHIWAADRARTAEESRR